MLSKLGRHLPVHSEGGRPLLMLYKLGVYVRLLRRCSIGERLDVMETLKVCKKLLTFLLFIYCTPFLRDIANQCFLTRECPLKCWNPRLGALPRPLPRPLNPRPAPLPRSPGWLYLDSAAPEVDGPGSWPPPSIESLSSAPWFLGKEFFFFLLCFYTSRCIIIIFN